MLFVGISQTSLMNQVIGAIRHFFEYGFTFTENHGEKTVVDMKMHWKV